MPGIKISAAIRNAFPPSERASLETELWAKSSGLCFLCGRPLNKATDDIECDHHIPESEGGLTTLANLNLVHRQCNRFKRNAGSGDVRPYLKFRAFLDDRKHGVRYGECLPYFGVTPKHSHIEFPSDNEIEIHFPNGTQAVVPILVEKRQNKLYRFAFASVPIDAIFNDDAVQPRTVKPNHVYSILLDLARNPLHEAPSCRVEMDSQGKAKLLMFDGQHKTLATWLIGDKEVTMKLYLDFDQASATELVNSIQAKIKKLPLSPFELSAKLSDEWSQKLEQYETEVGDANASEAGFIAWLPSTERSRAKSAFKAALNQSFLAHPDLDILSQVAKSGDQSAIGKISENVFKTKILDILLYQHPLAEAGEEMVQLRETERKNVVEVLNAFSQLAFDDDGSPQATVRIKRISYQSSLEYASKLLRGAVKHFISPGDDKAFLEKAPTEEQWKRIKEAIKRLVEHKVWTAEFDTADMKAVELALSKNQGAEAAFAKAGLTLGFVVGV